MLTFVALDQEKNHHVVPNSHIPFAHRVSHRISKEDRRHIRLSPIYGELQHPNSAKRTAGPSPEWVMEARNLTTSIRCLAPTCRPSPEWILITCSFPAQKLKKMHSSRLNCSFSVLSQELFQQTCFHLFKCSYDKRLQKFFFLSSSYERNDADYYHCRRDYPYQLYAPLNGP